MFQKAHKKQIKLKLALTGPSGSGKTYSALLLAKGIRGRVAVIDTENGSASLYSDKFEFDVCELSAPYTTEKYIAAMKAAEAAKYDIIIIDSLTHQWAGEGGILNRKEQLDARGGNSFTNWSKFTPEHEKFKAAILHLQAHTICTIRSKQDYHMGENNKGKMAPQKVGLAPIQRDSFEYEFSIVFDLAIDHSAKASKDRAGIFDKEIFTIDEKTGEILKEWLMKGEPIVQTVAKAFINAMPADIKPKATRQQLQDLWNTAKYAGVSAERLKQLMNDEPFKAANSQDLSSEQVVALKSLLLEGFNKELAIIANPENSEIPGERSEFQKAVDKIPDPRDFIK